MTNTSNKKPGGSKAPGSQKKLSTSNPKTSNPKASYPEKSRGKTSGTGKSNTYKTKNKKTGNTASSRNRENTSSPGIRTEVFLWSLLAVALLLAISNFGGGGFIGNAVSNCLFGLFGIVAWIFPFLLFGGSAFYIANKKNALVIRKLSGCIACFFLACAFMQLLTVGYNGQTKLWDYYLDSVYDHLGGGLFGGLIVHLLGLAFGTIGAYIIVIIGIIISVVVMTQRPFMPAIRNGSRRAIKSVQEQHRESAKLRRDERIRRAENSAEADDEEPVGGWNSHADKGMVNDPAKDRGIGLHKKDKDNDSDREAAGKKVSFFRKNELPSEKKPDEEEKKPIGFSINRGMRPEEPELVQTQASAAAPESPEASEPPVRQERKKQPKSSPEEQEAQTQKIRQEIDTAAVKSQTPVYRFPPVSLLTKSDSRIAGDSDAHLRETAQKLEETLRNFGVNVTITNVSCGPTVTRYELQPEQGVKVSRIVSLTDDIKLNLAAADIRIEAPIPGKAAVGIEVPNATNTPVMLRDLVESAAFRKHPSNIAFAVGKDIAGQPVITDIAKMPHLLIAGATGSGKSVCINTLIISILYKAKPEDVRLIMIDPKVVELSVYNGIPHLYIPVVTDPKKASGALNWAVAEMTDRYNKFAEYNVRDIKGYNAMVAEQAKAGGTDLLKMPQIVIIVDELADLMMVAPGEVEDAICRLAQLARAAGIHLIIATQRPSVNVITGLIKANMPSRIAFSVSSGVDSRTILDMNGAEKLLGKGDMLFKPQDYQKPARLQGSFVSDKEVSAVVAFLKEQFGEAVYSPEMEQKISRAAEDAAVSSAGGDERDAYFAEAGRFIIEKDKASIGMLQRVYKIGFNRAARIMDQLCEAGVVGEEEGTKPRKILMTAEQFEEYLGS